MIDHDEMQDSLLGNESRNSFSSQVKVQIGLKCTPKSFTDKEPFVTKLPFAKCFASDDSSKLSRRNLKAFYTLGLESDVLFDETEPKHIALLFELHNLVFPDKLEEPSDALRQERWKDFGFQCDRPGSDFRGGGVLSLKAMLYFVKKEEDVVEDAKIYMSKNDNYLFACEIISSAFFLKNFLHFGLYKTYNEKFDKDKTCSQKALKYFLSLEGNQHYNSCLDNFFQLVTVYNLKLYSFWKQACNQNKALRIIDFKAAEKIVTDLFKQMFEEHAHRAPEGEDLEVFIAKFSNAMIDQEVKPFVLIH